MKTLARVQWGWSEYDDQLWEILGAAGRRERHEEMSGWDYIELLPYLVFAGASVVWDESDEYVLTVPDNNLDEFYAFLQRILR